MRLEEIARPSCFLALGALAHPITGCAFDGEGLI